MSWQLLISASVLLNTASYLIYRLLAKVNRSKSASLAIPASLYFAQIFAVLVYLALNPHVDMAKVASFWYLIALGGIGFGFANFFLYKLLNYLDSGISSLLGMLNVLFTVLFAYLILHEKLSYIQLAGSVLMLVAVAYALLVASQPGKHRLHSRAWSYGLGFALLAGVFYGAAAVNEKYLIEHLSFGAYLVFGWGAQIVGAQLLPIVFQPSSYKVLKNLKIFCLSMAGGGLRGFSGLLYLLALKRSNNVSLMQVVLNLRFILIILFGAWLLHEHHKLKQKLAAALVSVVGLTILLWK